MEKMFFVMLYLFSTKHVSTQIYFCDQTKTIATCSARLEAGKLHWRCKNELVFRPQILWFVAVFSSLVCLLWERPLDTACKCQRAGSFRAIFRYYLAKLVKLWSSYAHAPLKRCFKSLQTENQKIALNDLREATASHLSEDCVSIRDSVVEKTATNHFVYYHFNIIISILFSLCPTIPVLLVNSNALFLVLLLTPFTYLTLTVLLEFGTLFLLSIIFFNHQETNHWQHFLSTFNPHNTCSWFFCCPCLNN